MDFFTQQDQARRSSRRLVWLFAGAVLALLAILNLALALGMNQAAPPPTPAERGAAHLLLSLATAAVVAIGSWWKTAQLARGGEAVAEMLGGRRIEPGAADPHERRLLNVVEEMAIASGVPMPPVYVLDEPGINAFAAGFRAGDGVVAVTRGTLMQLNRDELQGVVAHEFSHLLNGDARLNIRIMGLLYGILILGLAGRGILRMMGRSRSSSRRDKGGGQAAVIGIALALLVVGYVGFFLGQLIKAALSRQREYLADASAVQFTRNPGGLGGALKKIGVHSSRSLLRNTKAEEASHFFFANAVSGPLANLFSTHPPLESRIRAVDPQWSGEWPEVPPIDPIDERYAPDRPPVERRALQPEMIVPLVGSISPERVAFGAGLLHDLPGELVAAARDPYSARALVLALLLEPGTAGHPAALDAVASGDPALLAEVRRLHAHPTCSAPGSRLPLANLALGALRRLSPGQRTAFISLANAVVHADDHVTVAEYALLRLLEHTLIDRPRAPTTYHAIKPLHRHCAVLLAALAAAGSNDEAKRRHAFAAGARPLLAAGEGLVYPTPDEAGLARIDAALTALAQANPGIKRRVVNACAFCVAADGRVEPREAELLRLVGACLDCPLPAGLGAEVEAG